MTERFKKFLFSIYIAIFAVMVIGTTYAYFVLFRVSSVSPDIEVTSVVLPNFYFEIEKKIEIDAHPEVFEYGMGDLTSSTFAKARLYFEEEISEVYNAAYNISLDISINTLEYVTANKQAELVLKVIDPNGNEVTEIPELTYVSSESVHGFDITEAKGKYMIASNYPISTTKSTEQTWNVSVTLVNLNVDQERNIDKAFKGELKLEKVG